MTERNKTDLTEAIMEKQWDRIDRVRQRADVSKRKMAIGVGKSHSAWRHWVDRDDLPKELLMSLARYFTELGIKTSWEWLRDGEHSGPPRPLDGAMLRDVMKAIRQACEEEGLYLDEDTAFDLVALIYPICERSGGLDTDWVRAQVRMSANRSTDKR